MRHHPTRRIPAGLTLPEMLIALTVVSAMAAVGYGAVRDLREGTLLRATARTVRGHLAFARSQAVARRETLRVRLDDSGDLVVLTASGERLASATIGRGAEIAVDSIRLRPGTLRFNARGQAAPGSVSLYRGDRTVRIVSNFLGRLRTEFRRMR